MKKIFNIVNGDCLAEQLKETPITGTIIVCREAMVLGELMTENLANFWKKRAEHISSEYEVPENEYFEKSVSQFEQILDISEDSELRFWFEDDLFCQVNFWFCISLVSEKKNVELYRVFPKTYEKHLWTGFSVSSKTDLEQALNEKILIDKNEITFILNLWKSFRYKDENQLRENSKKEIKSIRNLDQLIKIYLEKEYVLYLGALHEEMGDDFDLLYKKFQEKYAILGLGDLQVKALIKKAL